MKLTKLVSFALLVVVATLSAQSPNVPETGKVLLLDNQFIIEGEITRVGDEYSVKRDGAGEVLIPKERVLKLVQSRSEAFGILREKRQANDVDARIKLARWGLVHQLHSEALVEAEAAVKLRPEDPQANALVKGLKQLIDKPMPLHPPESRGAPSEPEEATMPLGFNPNSFGPFTQKVQPMLMNLCASCHATGKGGNYRLVRVFDGGNRKGTVLNLAATLNQINRENPSVSPLLARAVMAHGESAKPPISDPQSGAYILLEEWASNALKKGEESSRDRGSFATSKPTMIDPEPIVKKTPVRPPLIGGNVPLVAEEESQSAPKAPAKTGEAFGSESASTPAKKDKPIPMPKDEFDPSIFNQQTPPKK